LVIRYSSTPARSTGNVRLPRRSTLQRELGDGRRGRQHTSRPRALGPSSCAEFRGSPRTRQLILQLGVSHLRRGRIARGGAKVAPLSDHLQLAAHRTARTLRHTGCPAYGYSAIRARRIPSFIVLGLLALFYGWLILSAIMSIILCALFVSWRFVA